MAVFEQSYKPYTGRLTPHWSRCLILPRYAYRDLFHSKIFTGFYALCFVCPLVMMIIIYLHYNVSAIAALNINLSNLVQINSLYFYFYVSIQASMAFLITLLIGPVLVSRDISNNAMPLYLCRPLSRTEYVIGKMSILIIILSLMTWIPGILLFFFQADLEGTGWLADNIWVCGAIFASSWVWILMMVFISIALSAWIKWRIAASAALFGLFTMPGIVSAMFNVIFKTRWGNIININSIYNTIAFSLFRREPRPYDVRQLLPLWAAWALLGLLLALCLLLLSRKIKAYEVVR